MPRLIERTSPTDLMQLASDLPGAPMQVAAVLVLDPASAVDLAAVRERLVAAGSEVRDAGSRIQSRERAFVRDPVGNLVELVEIP